MIRLCAISLKCARNWLDSSFAIVLGIMSSSAAHDAAGQNAMSALTQDDAERLLQMKKCFLDRSEITMFFGYKEQRFLVGEADDTSFKLDIAFGTKRRYKIKLQTRHHSIELVRLEVNSTPHTNPDGSTIDGDHIHIYDEKNGSKFAYQIDPDRFPSLKNCVLTFRDFCDYCNICKGFRPTVRHGLII